MFVAFLEPEIHVQLEINWVLPIPLNNKKQMERMNS